MSKLYTKMIALMTAMALLVPVMARAADDPNPYLKPDESWISISGTAVDPLADRFTLDYGEGTVTVEMDDWDWYPEASKLIDGDKVTVYGEIDDDLYETTTIEASSVYVENLGTYFYASSADEEFDDDYDYWFVGAPIVVGQMTVRGTVTSVSDREFTIDTGARKLTVDTIAMPFNPLDDKGFQEVDTGDYVSATGNIDIDAFEERELMADSVTVLYND